MNKHLKAIQDSITLNPEDTIVIGKKTETSLSGNTICWYAGKQKKH